MARLVGLVAALGTVAAPGAAGAATLFLALPTPAAPCSFATVAAALDTHPDWVVAEAGEGRATAADLVVAIEREGSDWSLTVSANARRELRRALPAPGSDCLLLSQTVAFVVERRLAALDRAGPAAALQAPEVVVAAPATASASEAWHGLVSLGLGAEFFQPNVTPTLELELGLRRSVWQFALAATLPASFRLVGSDDTPVQGALQMQGFSLGAPLGPRIPLPLGSLRVELLPGVEFTWARPLTPPAATILTARAFIGTRVSWELPLSERFALSVRLGGNFLLGEGDPDKDSDVNLGNFEASSSLALLYDLF